MPQTPRAFPVSPGQARLWYLQQLYPDSSANNLNVLLTRLGPLDAGPLRVALAGLVARHEPLRTTFADGPDGPDQLVHPDPGELPLAEDDLSGLAPAERATALRALQDRDARAPFDLSRWPLLRVRLVHLGDSEHALVLVVHHVVVDAASIQVLAGDLAELYQAAVEGCAAVLPELRIQYVDYVAWQAGRLAGPEARAALDWWQATLAGVPPLRLVPGRPRPADLGAGAEREEIWEPGFGRRLAELGGAVRATPFMTVLAGWAALLARCTGADDFAVGVPMSDRPSEELDRVVGYFVDMVGVRVDLTGDPPFRELLVRVRDAVIEGFERRTVPFEQVVDAVRPERSATETPLFQVGLNLVPSPSEERGGFWSDGQEYGDGGVKYDLFLTLYERAGGSYGVVVDWRVGLLPDEVAGGLPGSLRTLLAAAAGAPDTPLSQLPLSGPRVDPRLPTSPYPPEAAVTLLPWSAPAPGAPTAGAPVPGAATAGAPAPGAATAGAGDVELPWSASAPGGATAGAGDVVLAGEGWSAALARSWAATGARVYRSWTPPGGDRPVLGGPWRDEPGAVRAPLGRPLDGITASVLGPDGRPVPAGLPGQLHVATGDGAQAPTGTLVRVLPGGQLEYAGPVDGRVVRVGGYPVEPATIEAALLDEPEVAAATVLVDPGQPAVGADASAGRVVAYVRAVAGTRPTGAALRGRLGIRLSPAYLPAAIVVLTDPPLRADGTLDTRLLPATGDQEDTVEHVPPRTPVERQLARIWADVLGQERVGVTDNFFALGGDSFLCLRVVTAAAALGLPITPVELFARQTIAALADRLPAVGAAPAEPELPSAVLRRLDPRPRLVAELDRPVPPAALAGWPVLVEPGRPVRLVGDAAVLDEWSWTELLTALAAGTAAPAPPAALELPAGEQAVGEPPLLDGDWTAVQVTAPLDETAARDALGGAAVDLVVAALAAVLPGPRQVVEVSDVDRLLGSADGRQAGRHARDVRTTVPTGHSGQWIDLVREVKEAVRAAAAGGGPADPPAVAVGVLPALPPGARDVDDGSGAVLAPLDVRVRLAAGSAELTLRGLSRAWPPPALRELATSAAAALGDVGAAVAGLGGRMYTPSDFPAAELSQDQLDRLLDRLSGGR